MRIWSETGFPGDGVASARLELPDFTIVPELSHPIEWECDCGCLIPLSVLQPAGDGLDKALAAFLAWLSSNGHALRGGNLDLRPEDAAALSGLAGEPLVDLRYRHNGTAAPDGAARLNWTGTSHESPESWSALAPRRRQRGSRHCSVSSRARNLSAAGG
jgi:hypothetical protein